MGIRSFLAFEPPPEIREQIGNVSRELKTSALPVRWVNTENMHLTILFLGNLDEDTIQGLKETATVVAKQFPALTIRLNGIGVFPHVRRPRVIWAGLDGDTERLSDLRDRLQKELKGLGLQQEKRPLRAHLTLGRFKGRMEKDEELKWILDKYHNLSSGPWYLNELILFRSDLKPQGPIYTKMAVCPLRNV